MSPKQLGNYHKLAKKAFEADLMRNGIKHLTPMAFKARMADWRYKINVDTTGKHSSTKMTNADFDKVMLELAIIAGDDYWIGRCSTNDVRVLRWILETQFIPDLEFLEKRKIDWGYIKGICKQANFPQSIMDCPAPMLECVLMMADTHIRRLAKREGIEIIDLPSGRWRKGVRPSDKARAMFRHDHHHHITHGEAA